MLFKENMEEIKMLVESRSEEAFRNGLRNVWDAKVTETVPLVTTHEEFFELARFVRYGDKENQLKMYQKILELGPF